MADKNSGWACTASISVVAETNTTATIRVICYWKNQGWRYAMNGVSAWVYMNGSAVCVKDSGSIDTQSNNQASFEMGRHDFVVNKTTSVQSIPFCAKITSTSSYVSGTKWSGDTYINVAALPSYTVSYNANGGSGGPGNQTKWYNSNITLSSSIPSRTGHNFVRWNTNTANTGTGYAPGQVYSGNANLALYAIWSPYTHTVAYNANGGSNAPASQTKTYGSPLYLTTAVPTRTNYNFKGWSTSANGGVVYQPGGYYGADQNGGTVTLYAVWELAYVKPRITGFKAQRCTSNGTASETGTYIKCTFNWATDRDVTEVVIDWKIHTHSWTTGSYNYLYVNASGKSGTVSQIVGNGNISTEITYIARAYVNDGTGSTHSVEVSIGTPKYPIDIRCGGNGVAFGKVAEKEDTVETAYPIRSAEIFNRAAWNTPTKGLLTQVTDNTGNQHSVIVGLKSDGQTRIYGIDLIDNDASPVMRLYAGKRYLELNSGSNTITTCTNTGTSTGTIRPGVQIYDNGSGSNVAISNLTESANNFNFLEIYFKHSQGYGSQKIHAPNGKTVSLMFAWHTVESGHALVQYVTKRITISGTNITPSSYAAHNARADGGYWISNTSNDLYIVRVIGYR